MSRCRGMSNRGEFVTALRIAIFLALAAGSLPAQHEEVKNPHTSAEDVAAGGRIFRSHCAVCHGLNGVGDRAPALTTGRFRHGGSDGAVQETISKGIAGTEMPGIFFNGVQLWQLVAYVQSLSKNTEVEQPTGDATAGKTVYTERGCNGCHRVNGEGGRSGPDLSDIGASRSLPHLRDAILNPSAKVLPRDWTVKAVTKDGTSITGRRMNEDTFSLQVLDAEERLVSLAKTELSSYEVSQESTMPAYQGMIRGKDLDNLLAYLVSLRQRRAAQ
jgi:putative heme-binding domain-containing protein